MGDSILWGLVAVCVLVALNGMFVAAEFAIISVRRTRLTPLAERGSAAARIALRAARDPNPFLAAAQLGITMASLGLGWIGEPAVATVVEPWIAGLPLDIRAGTTRVLSATLAFLFITVLHIVFGEQAAKSAALWRPEATALLTAPPTAFFHQVFRPLIWLLNAASNSVLGLFGVRAPSGGLVYSSEEIGMLVTESQRAGAVEKEEAVFVHRVFKFTDRVAEEVMVPRVSIRGLPKESTVRESVNVVREVGYSRLPVFDESLDRIVGMVHVRDLLFAEVDGRGEQALDTIMRPVLYVPETKPVVDLLNEMRHKGIQLAVVLDEYAGTEGIVTIEDLLEEIVGEIPGEFRKEPPLVVVQQPDRIVVDAAIPLEVLNEVFHIDLPTDAANTLGGFIFHHLGSIPEAGRTFRHDALEFRIESATRNRIGLVQIRKLSAGQEV
ncbi:MAG TPA: hemolysin family protein [bacterium]|nr:hemolysin family protein [bacterium]